jgi:hypothetical protein
MSASVTGSETVEAVAAPAAPVESRRSLLRSIVAAAAGAMGAQALAGPARVGAANGGPMLLGVVNNATLQTAVVNSAAHGRGLTGRASSATQSAASIGVFGQSDARLGSGVYGTGHTGVYGRGNAIANNWGVGGKGTFGVVGDGVVQGVTGYGREGVVGQGTTRGVTGRGPDGVAGFATDALSKGVYGEGDYGVYGKGTFNAASWGVYGTGAYGLVADGTQAGVSGRGPVGVLGDSGVASGKGVYGEGDFGVFGRGNVAANSYGVYGIGPYGVVAVGTTRGVSGSGPTGVFGASAVANGSGVYGRGDYGVFGIGTFNDQSWGVYGSGRIGVVGSGAVVGVWGGSSNTGVQAVAPGLGVYAQATTQPSDGYLGIAIYGLGNANAEAGRFSGNVSVFGQLIEYDSATLHIDHPLDPANRYLTHSAVSSPDQLNVYSGSVVLNGRGMATVRLPRYYDALNSDHRVQLTAVGAAAPGLHVAQEVADGRFQIAGGASGQKVFWQVTGIRRDAWARKHRIKVEPLKRPGDRGRYLAPELFGKRRAEGIGYVKPPKPLRFRKPLGSDAPAIPRKRPATPRLPERRGQRSRG